MKRRVGRPRLTPAAREFREEIARQLQGVMNSPELNLTVTGAAAALGVSRQSFHQYLAALTTPNPEIIVKAIDLWGIKPVYKGQEISRGGLGTAGGRKESPTATQLSLVDLFDVPQECHNDNLVIVLKRTRDSSLQVTIKMKKLDGLRRPREVRGAAAK